MRLCLFTLFLVLALFCGSISAFSCDSLCLDSATLDVGLGYRNDQLDWNIAGDASGANPNVLSELTWDDLKISQLQLAGQLELAGVPLIQKNVLILADVAFGKIWSGTVQDSDYDGDDRTDETSRSVGDADSGFTADISGAFGPIFKFDRVTGLHVTPLIGYGFNMQAVTMTNGEQVVAGSGTRELGYIPGLDSTYTAYWYGPWLGTTVDYRFNEKLMLALGFEYHWVNFFAQADWNLRTEFEHPVSFEHEGTGSGIVWDINGAYHLNEKWKWTVSTLFQDWSIKNGTDRTFLSDGSVGKTRLNQVNWKSYAVMTGLCYQF